MAFRPPENSTPAASSVKQPEFRASNYHNCCAEEDDASARQCCVEEGSKAGHCTVESSMHEEQLCHTIEHLEKPENKSSKSKSRRSNCAEKRRDNDSGCNCAGRVAGDCAAVCCCPCVIVHVLILALVKLPVAIARKAFFRAKKMGSIGRKSENKKTNEKNDDDDHKLEKCRVYSPSWSFRESPQMTESPEGLPSPKFESEKLWSELFATGHMGFSGVPCQRD